MIGSLSYRQYLDALRSLLSGELPGSEAQLAMGPDHRRSAMDHRITDKQCKEAAVLALLYPDAQSPPAPRLLLTVRPAGMANHAGQVAFPGGRLEAGESHVDAALRETEEEVHIPRANVEILGPLTPLYIPPTGFCVHPFVGAISYLPDLNVTSDEVDSLFGVAVRDLRDPGVRGKATRVIRDRSFEVPCFALDGEIVWGATAMMLSELSVLIERIEPPR